MMGRDNEGVIGASFFCVVIVLFRPEPNFPF